MRKMAENTLNREMKFVLRWKIWAMSVLHFGGERSKGCRGPCVPRFNREVQARIVCDAIVSTKTFRNATFPPKWKVLQSWFQQNDLFLPTSQVISRHAVLHLSGYRRGNEILPPGSKLTVTSSYSSVVLWLDLLLVSRCTRDLHGHINLCGRGAREMRGHGILEEPPPLHFAAEPTHFRETPPPSGLMNAAGAWSNR